MARFIGLIEGAGKPITRLGNKLSGLKCGVNGWDSGVHVLALVDEKGNDTFIIRVSGGSNNESWCKMATIRYVDEQIMVEFPEEIADIANSPWHEGPVPRINNE